MRVDDFDAATTALVTRFATSGVQYVALEDDDADALTIVPGPSQRNLDRLARVLRTSGARMAVAGPRLHYDEMIHGGPGRWPLTVGGAAIDVMIVGVGDGRWATYFHEARRVELSPGLHLDVVADAPILAIRRSDARAAMPELALTQRERDRLRERRRRTLSRRGRRLRSRA
ncbi:MAG TPA: hypothetical protein VFZ89_17355 [Solirubrobacteraceae bacterium]